MAINYRALEKKILLILALLIMFLSASTYAVGDFTGLTTKNITGQLTITAIDGGRTPVYELRVPPYRADEAALVYDLPPGTTFSAKTNSAWYDCKIGWTPGTSELDVDVANCTKKAASDLCGNGTKNTGEECDKAGANGACPATCSRTCKINSCSTTPPPDEEGGNEEGTTTTPSEPVSLGFSEKVTVDQTLVQTKGCGADGKYTSGILKGVMCKGATGALNPSSTPQVIVQIIKNIIDGFLIPTVGVLFITVIIVGGLVYISSGGNEESVKKGKKILTSGIIGLLIITLSYTIIRIFVFIMGGSIV